MVSLSSQLTPTQLELMNSSKFWKMRMEQQAEYFLRWSDYPHTRPDKDYVLDTAMAILEMCQWMYLSAYIMEEIGPIFTESECKRIILEHSIVFNATSQFFKVNVVVEKK